jgi:hypothetical protein
LCLPDVLLMCCSISERESDVIKTFFLVILLTYLLLGFEALQSFHMLQNYRKWLKHISGHDREWLFSLALYLCSVSVLNSLLCYWECLFHIVKEKKEIYSFDLSILSISSLFLFKLHYWGIIYIYVQSVQKPYLCKTYNLMNLE